jgi:hypothetical protein
MYRQIYIQEKDRVFQRILWRESAAVEVKEYELCTFTYGMSAAPFLAIRFLKQLDFDEGPNFLLAKFVYHKHLMRWYYYGSRHGRGYDKNTRTSYLNAAQRYFSTHEMGSSSCGANYVDAVRQSFDCRTAPI